MNNTVTGAYCQSPIEPNTLHFVSDDELLFRTRELARHETELTIVTIQHLDEIERRELYDQRGYPSLFEYAVRELHYSRGCAWRRIMVMKLCRAVPGITDKLRSGELNLTTASQLQNAIEKRARKAARKAARERASESVCVPAAGALSAGAGESASGEVQPGRAGVAGVAAAASGAMWAPVGAAATPAAVGESAAGQSAAGESPAGESAAAAGGAVSAPGGAAAIQVAAGESAAGQSAAGKSPAGKSPAGKSPAGKSPAGKSPAAESAAGQSAAGESAAGESAAGQSAAGKSPAGESAAAAPGAGWVPVGAAATQVAAGESAAGQSAAGESPAGESAAGESAAGQSAAAAAGAVWAPGGAAATQVAAGEPAARESAAAVPLPAGSMGTAPAAPGDSPHATAAARAAGKAAVAAPAAPAPAAASPVPGVARESALLPPVAEPPPAWTLDQQVELVDLVANKSSRETEKLLAELEPEVGLPRERQRALGGGRYELRVILDQGSVDTIAKLKGWLSHVNPGFTTGQLLAHLLQQAERKYDPMRERGRTKRGTATPARHAETCEQQLGVTNERQAAGSALGVAVSKADSSMCATGAPGAGEGVPATGAARASVAAGSVAADSVAAAPAPGPAAAGSADAGSPGAAPAAADPSGALAGGSAQNRKVQPVAAPDSEQDRRDTPGSAENQQPPVVPDRSGDRIPRHAAGWIDPGSPAPGPASAGPSGALAGGSAQNRKAQPVAAPDSEQDRRDTPGSARNQQPPRAGIVGARTKTEPHDGVRAQLPEDGSAAPPPAPESSRESRARRHIPVAVRRAVWRRYGGACCYQDPLTGVTCGSTHLVQIDHIVPVAQGGSDDISNLRLRCSVHNRRRDPRCASYRSAPAAPRGRSRSISTPSNHESS